MLDQSFRYNPQVYGPTGRERLLNSISSAGMSPRMSDSIFTSSLTEEERLRAEEELVRAKALAAAERNSTLLGSIAGEQPKGVGSSSFQYTQYRSTPESVGPMVDESGNIITASTGSAIDMGDAMSPRREAFDNDVSAKFPLIKAIRNLTGVDLNPDEYAVGQLQDILARETGTTIEDVREATGFTPNELPKPRSIVRENMSLEQLNEVAASMFTVPQASLLEGLSPEEKARAIEEGFNQTTQNAIFRNIQQRDAGLTQEQQQENFARTAALLSTNFENLNDSQKMVLGRQLLSSDIIDTSAMSDEEIGRLHMGNVESFIGGTLGMADWVSKVAPGLASIASNKILNYWKSNGLLGKLGIPNPVMLAYNSIKDAWTNSTDPAQDDPRVTAFFRGTPVETIKDLKTISRGSDGLNLPAGREFLEQQTPKAPSILQAFTTGQGINEAVDAQTDMSEFEKQALKTAALGVRSGIDNVDRWTSSVLRGVLDIFFDIPSAEDLTQRFEETGGREGVDIGGVRQQILQQQAADINELTAVEGGAMLTEELVRSPLLIGGGSAVALGGKKVAELGLRGASKLAPGVISATGFGAKVATEAALPTAGALYGGYTEGTWQGAAKGAAIPIAFRLTTKLGGPKVSDFAKKFDVTGKAREKIASVLDKSPQAGTYVAGKLAKMADKIGDAKLAGYWGEVASQGVGSATLMGVLDGLAMGDVGAGFQSAMQNGIIGTGAAMLLSSRVPASRFRMSNTPNLKKIFERVKSDADRRVVRAYKGIYGDNVDIVPAKDADFAQRQAYEYQTGGQGPAWDQARPADMPQPVAPNAWLVPDPAGNNKAKLFIAPDKDGNYANALHDAAPSVMLTKATDPAAKAQLFATVYRNTPAERLNKIAADNDLSNWRSDPVQMQQVLGIAVREELKDMGGDILRPAAKGDSGTKGAIRNFINGKGGDIKVDVPTRYTVGADPETGKYTLMLEDRPSAVKRQEVSAEPTLKDNTTVAPKSELISKADLDAEAKRLGANDAKQFNINYASRGDHTPEQRALLERISERSKQVKQLNWEDASKLDADDFTTWENSKLRSVADTEADLTNMSKLHLAQKARGNKLAAEKTKQAIRDSRRDEKNTIKSWNEKTGEKLSQKEIDAINANNARWNEGVDGWLEIFDEIEVQPSSVQGVGGKPTAAATPTQAVPEVPVAARPEASVKATERIQARKRASEMNQTEKKKALREIGLTQKYQKQLTPEQQDRAINMGPNFSGLNPNIVVQMVKKKVPGEVTPVATPKKNASPKAEAVAPKTTAEVAAAPKAVAEAPAPAKATAALPEQPKSPRWEDIPNWKKEGAKVDYPVRAREVDGKAEVVIQMANGDTLPLTVDAKLVPNLTKDWADTTLPFEIDGGSGLASIPGRKDLYTRAEKLLGPEVADIPTQVKATTRKEARAMAKEIEEPKELADIRSNDPDMLDWDSLKDDAINTYAKNPNKKDWDAEMAKKINKKKKGGFFDTDVITRVLSSVWNSLKGVFDNIVERYQSSRFSSTRGAVGDLAGKGGGKLELSKKDKSVASPEPVARTPEMESKADSLFDEVGGNKNKWAAAMRKQYGKENKETFDQLWSEINSPRAEAKLGDALPNTPANGQFYVIEGRTADGRRVKYKLDPRTNKQPIIAELQKIDGEDVVFLEADRMDTVGGNQGGPDFPNLLDNQIVITLPDGRSFKGVWANLGLSQVTALSNKVQKTTSGRALVTTMTPDAHRSNKDMVRKIATAFDSANLRPEENTIVRAMFGLQEFAVKVGNVQSKLQANINRLQKIKNGEFDFDSGSTMSEKYQAYRNKTPAEIDAEIKANQAKIDKTKKIYANEFDLNERITKAKLNRKVDKFDEIVADVGNEPWFKKLIGQENVISESIHRIDSSFNSRKAIAKRLQGLPFGPDVKAMLNKNASYQGAKNGDVVGVVQLSKDKDVRAVYFGKKKSQESKMTTSERYIRDELLKAGYKPHGSYDWVMLGPGNADNFTLSKPIDATDVIGDYQAKNPKKTIREGTKETVLGTIKKTKAPIRLKVPKTK